MQPLVKRALLRLLLVGLIGATFLPIGLARGQIGDVPSNPPGQEPRERQLEMAENPATAPEPDKGLQPAEEATQPATVNVGSVNAVTAKCADSSDSETRLGLMQNSAAYSHCP